MQSLSGNNIKKPASRVSLSCIGNDLFCQQSIVSAVTQGRETLIVTLIIQRVSMSPGGRAMLGWGLSHSLSHTHASFMHKHTPCKHMPLFVWREELLSVHAGRGPWSTVTMEEKAIHILQWLDCPPLCIKGLYLLSPRTSETNFLLPLLLWNDLISMMGPWDGLSLGLRGGQLNPPIWYLAFTKMSRSSKAT